MRRRQWHPTPVLLPGKSHGWRSLEGCSPWGRWGSDTTERLHFHFSLSWVGEGNGNPLQCSCLENPRDGGAWWAAVYGVTQSRIRLKWLSSSSSRIQHEQLCIAKIFSNGAIYKTIATSNYIYKSRQTNPVEKSFSHLLSRLQFKSNGIVLIIKLVGAAAFIPDSSIQKG